MPGIAYYITSHGFGHATRAIEVINHIPEEIPVEIVTTVPRWLFKNSLHRPFAYHELLHDPGVVQVDSLHQDIDKTYKVWNELLERYPLMAESEAERLAGQGTTLVAGDISPFSVVVAQAAGLPSIIVANFSWNWIAQSFLDEMPNFKNLISRFEQYYAQCDLLLSTPLSGGLSIFPRYQDIPLIVRRSQKSKHEVKRIYNVKEGIPTVLVSFGGHGFNRIQPEHLKRYPNIQFLTFEQKFEGLDNACVLDTQATYHPDALNAADLVLSKLGYGIVTECIAHRVPIAYPPRKNFPEYDVMARETPGYVDTIPLSEEQFFGGDWDFLEDYFSRQNIDDIRNKETMALNGGEVAARMLSQKALISETENRFGT